VKPRFPATQHPSVRHPTSNFKAEAIILLLNYLRLTIASLMLLISVSAQSQKAPPQPSPTPLTQDEPVKVFTEEVRLPVIAVDQFGHYDPTVIADDVMVLEDGVAQPIRSIRRIPANVLLVLDTGGELSGLGGMSKRTNLTRAVAIEILNRLRDDVWVEVIQFNNSVSVLQGWSRDRAATLEVLKTKVSSGKRARFSDAVVVASQELKERPEGSRHVIFITDGVDSGGGKIDRSQAIKQLATARATVHIISYTEFVLQKDEKNKKLETGQLPTSHDPITTMDPTLPPGTTRSPSYGVTIRFDPAMRRQRKAYESDVRRSQQVLTTMADETGGQIFLPKNAEEMFAQAREAAREVGAEYVLTYRPKRPLSESAKGEYRRVEVVSRRVGLTLRSRRGYVVPTPP
jgi:VWFA-related protein